MLGVIKYSKNRILKYKKLSLHESNLFSFLCFHTFSKHINNISLHCYPIWSRFKSTEIIELDMIFQYQTEKIMMKYLYRYKEN